MPRPQPDPDPHGFWPSCDDEQPGVSIRPLSHADLAALLAHLDHNQDPDDALVSAVPAPVVAVRVRASVGRPAPPPRPSIGADGPPSWPAGPAACPGGWSQWSPSA
jgi:hypothetical protein